MPHAPTNVKDLFGSRSDHPMVRNSWIPLKQPLFLVTSQNFQGLENRKKIWEGTRKVMLK